VWFWVDDFCGRDNSFGGFSYFVGFVGLRIVVRFVFGGFGMRVFSVFLVYFRNFEVFGVGIIRFLLFFGWYNRFVIGL